MKILKIIIGLIIGLALAFGVLMFWKAYQSKKVTPSVGVTDGKLKACGAKPNCVSSFADGKFYVAPIEAGNIEVVWDNLNLLLPDLGLEIVSSSSTYIHATETTKMMGFVDDVEFLLDTSVGKIYLRSASRVGYSDMGANRKRLEKITQTLMSKP